VDAQKGLIEQDGVIFEVVRMMMKIMVKCDIELVININQAMELLRDNIC